MKSEDSEVISLLKRANKLLLTLVILVTIMLLLFLLTFYGGQLFVPK